MKQIIYEPQEDSLMLEYYVRKFAKGIVLDMGTGGGIQAVSAASKDDVEKVYAVDVNKEAIEFCKKKFDDLSSDKKIVFLVSDLFKNLKNLKFDTIIFNPPYLPQDNKFKRLALEGGKKGYEVVANFLKQASKNLKPEGNILLLFSSLTDKYMIDGFIEKNLFEFEQIATKSLFFETLYVYLVKKTAALKFLEQNKIKFKYFASGKRGIVFTANYERKKVAIKVKKKESEAIASIQNEARILQLVNKEGIGPRFVDCGENFVVYEFVTGIQICKWIEKASKSELKRVFESILKQCFALDKMGISKEEMHRPLKHILVGKNIVLIYFERAHYSRHPQNVTQFLQYIMKHEELLKKQGFRVAKSKLIMLGKEYHKKRSEKELYDIMDVFI